MPKLVSVQVLRAAAALAVALLHATAEGPGPFVVPFPLEAGVDVFFVLSGFVMVYASGPLFGKPGAPRVFAARRIARIVPLYWLTTLGVLALRAVRPDILRSDDPDGAAILASFAFIPHVRPDGAVQPVYSLGWTLNYEMAFYGLFALAILLPRRSAVAAALGALLGLVGVGLLRPGLPQPWGAWTDPILLEFAAGLLLGLMRAEGVTLPVPARLGLAVLGLAIFGALGAGAASFGLHHRAVQFTLPASCLVAACGFARGDLKPGRDGWAVRAAALLGDASYAMYLLHPFAVRGAAVLFAAGGFAPAAVPVAFCSAALAATVVLAIAAHAAVERPMVRLARRALEPRRMPRESDVTLKPDSARTLPP